MTPITEVDPKLILFLIVAALGGMAAYAVHYTINRLTQPKKHKHTHTWEKQYEIYEDGDDSYTWINLCRCGAWQKKKLFRRTGMKSDHAIITDKSENA